MRIFPFYFLKKIFKLKYLAHKYLLKTTKHLKYFYRVYLTPNFYDTTFMYYFKGTYGFFLNDFLKNISIDTNWFDFDSQNKNVASCGFSKFEKIGAGLVHYDMLISRN